MRNEPWHFDGRDAYGPLGSQRLGILIFMNRKHTDGGNIDWGPMARIWLPVLLPIGFGISLGYDVADVLKEIEEITDTRFQLRGDALKQRLAEFSTALVIQQSDRYMSAWMADQVSPDLPGGDVGSAACLASFAASKEKAKATPTKKR